MASNRNVIFTRNAEEDLVLLLEFTEEHWDFEQLERYRDSILDKIATLASFPNIATSRDELLAGLRSFPVEQHIAYMFVHDDSLVVLRLLHKRMKAADQDWSAFVDQQE